MYKKSIWEINMKNKKCDKLEKNIITDVLIIGGGITGISTAFYLMDSDKKIMLVEQNQIGSGVTSKTTGKLTYLQELVYSKLEKTFNYEYSKLYLESQLEAIYLVKSNIKKYKIQCDFSEVPSYTFTNNEYEIPKFKNEETFLKKSLINYEICNSIPINYPCKYAIKVNDTAVFHPIKYLFKLKEICIKNKVKIYENTKVTSIKKVDNNYICTCNGYNVIAKTVVLCCHYPFFLLPGFFPIKTKIEESYLMATPINSYNDFSAITNTYPTKSFRYHKDNKNIYIIFVAQSHNLAFNLNRQERYKALKNEFRKTLKLNGKYYWTNQDIITDDSLPIIGNLSNKYPNLLIGTGYNTWGNCRKNT